MQFDPEQGCCFVGDAEKRAYGATQPVYKFLVHDKLEQIDTKTSHEVTYFTIHIGDKYACLGREFAPPSYTFTGTDPEKVWNEFLRFEAREPHSMVTLPPNFEMRPIRTDIKKTKNIVLILLPRFLMHKDLQNRKLFHKESCWILELNRGDYPIATGKTFTEIMDKAKEIVFSALSLEDTFPFFFPGVPTFKAN